MNGRLRNSRGFSRRERERERGLRLRVVRSRFAVDERMFVYFWRFRKEKVTVW